MLFIKDIQRKSVFFASFIAAFSALFCFISYELFRSSAESVFLSRYNASDKVYALAVVPLILILIIFIYSKVLDRLGPKIVTILSFLVFFILMITFYYGSTKKISFFIFSVLIFKEAYIVVLSEIYWSYINSILKINEAKLLNGYIAGFGALGSVIGGYLVVKMIGFLSTEKLFLLSSFFLLFALLIMWFAYNYELPSFFPKNKNNTNYSYIKNIVENDILKVLFVTVFISQIFSTFADLNFTEYLKKEIPLKDERTKYLGNFWTTVNIFSFTFQFILSPLLLRNLKPIRILFFIPIVHVFSVLYAIFNPSLFTASVVFFLFKSLDYSIYRAAKETLYIPFDFDIRFKTKQLIDAFNYRFAKGFISIFLSFLNSFGFKFFPYLMPLSLVISYVWFWFLKKLDKY
ncbi:MAG: hypothetical protein N2Z20_05875 [Elusimicrobiales bacterium]|nr:hypothetical protein [Elusimicrobiales bacterium]